MQSLKEQSQTLGLRLMYSCNNHDIMKYVAHRIDEDHNPVDMNSGFKKEIIEKIAAASQGMYVF